MRISDWSSDVCSSDLLPLGVVQCQRILGIRIDRHKQVVTDKVGGVEYGTPANEGLEDNLGVVALLQMNEHDFQVLEDSLNQRLNCQSAAVSVNHLPRPLGANPDDRKSTSQKPS